MNLTPEMRLAVETGIKSALKKIEKTAGDARDSSPSDVVMKNVIIDMRLSIDELAIGHDTDKSPTASIPWLSVMGLVIKRMGATRTDALTMVRKAMEDALTLDKDATETLLKEAGVAEAMELVTTEVINRLPRTKVKKSR